MFIEDEKDYIMRMIKEIVRALMSVILGRQYHAVELPRENKYEVSGDTLENYKEMVDRGEINEAENFLLEKLDYSNRDEVVAAIRFYEYISEKEDEFLLEHHYTKEEALDGLRQIAETLGYGAIIG